MKSVGPISRGSGGPTTIACYAPYFMIKDAITSRQARQGRKEES